MSIPAETIKDVLKDPEAILFYHWDWASWLSAEGDSISTATVTVDSPLTVVGSASITGGKVSAKISGGADGGQYMAKCKIVTAGGRTDVRRIRLNVRAR